MKKTITLLFISLLLTTCQKEEIRRFTKLKIDSVEPLTATSVKAVGMVIDFSNAVKKETGFCYSDTKQEPTTADSKKVVTGAKKAQQTTAELDNLAVNTTYYVRFYVEEEGETVYSPVKTITTPDKPEAQTSMAGQQTYNTTQLRALVNAKGIATQVFFEYGTTTDYGIAAVGTPTSLSGTTLQEVITTITGLQPNSLYNYRIKAVSQYSTVYGENKTFTTKAIELPIVVGDAISAVARTTATSGGNVVSDGGSPVTARGMVWASTQNPTIAGNAGKTTNGNGLDVFISHLTNLMPGTTYYARAYATNSVGTAYGDEKQFSTKLIELATISTTSVSKITQTAASSGGNISIDGGSIIYARGVVWATSQSPTIETNLGKTIDGTGTGNFASNLNGLVAGTTYYLRAYATNSAGTAYGNEIIFTTINSNQTITDIDGNVYNTITIGSQVWMVENLKTTHYRNGDPIINITDFTSWANAGPAYCWYNNDPVTYKETYGALYNFEAVSDSRGIAPAGWRVPTDQDWIDLIDYLGGENYAGGKLKESGTLHWIQSYSYDTNETGFTALPSGYRSSNAGIFELIGSRVYFWTSSEFDSGQAWARYFSFDSPSVYHYNYNKKNGFSVRCIRD